MLGPDFGENSEKEALIVQAFYWLKLAIAMFKKT